MTKLVDSYRFGAAGENYVTSGLINYIDARLPASYSGSGTDWFDITANAYDWTLNNSPGFTTSSPEHFSFVAASTDNATTTHGGSIFDGAIAFTLEVWMRTSTVATQVVYGRYNGGSTATAPTLFIISNKLRFYNSGGVGVYRTSASNVNDGNWHQVYLTFTGSTTMDIYLDNTLDNGSLTGAIPASVSSPAYALTIASSSANGIRYGGDIALTRVYNKVLSGAERLQNWDATRGDFGL